MNFEYNTIQVSAYGPGLNIPFPTHVMLRSCGYAVSKWYPFGRTMVAFTHGQTVIPWEM